jgi:hypothetical protein
MNIFLDLDGALTDPRQGIVACIKYALVALGHLISAGREHGMGKVPLLTSRWRVADPGL